MLKLDEIHYIERATGQVEQEKVYGEKAIALLYTKIGTPLRWAMARIPLLSMIYGYFQAQPSSAMKVAPFIKKFQVDPAGFVKRPAEFTSFNDFFIRKLKADARPISASDVVMPADGRYFITPDVSNAAGFIIKGRHYSLEKLVGPELAAHYKDGSMVNARLCPTDYHRYHFPLSGTPSQAKLKKGSLGSVNPTALRHNLNILTDNKRMVTTLQTEGAGLVTIVEVGATCVGTIHQTYTPDQPITKGQEKGYFSFGGSAMVVLFEKDRITFEPDLLDASERFLEIRCLMGQPLGKLNA